MLKTPLKKCILKVGDVFMLKRKIINELIEWKENTLSKRNALVIKGLRQVGKTFIVIDFAKKYYENQIYINFKNNDDIKAIFEENLDVDRILMDISAKFPNVKLIPHKTVIIFDEIQECSNARASLKSFVEDGRYDVIATGSLLGIKGYNKKIGKGVPTGSEHIIYMYPLDFEEFLWAKGISEDVINYLKKSFKNKTKISNGVHQSMLRYFKEYICVGGLPEVVNNFILTSDMNVVLKTQRDLIEEYRDDFAKHLDKNENEEIDYKLLTKINSVFDSIPSQLSKENKKFQYSKIKEKGRNSEFEDAIEWLVDSGIVSKCYNLHTLELPLEGNKFENIFKLYLNDTGLLMAMLEDGSSFEILNGNLGIYKGAIYENIIADIFSKMGKKLYYYHKDSGLEIDFIIKYEGNITLVEVKSKNGNTKSANVILNNFDIYKISKCIKIGEYNIGEVDNKITIPYYLAFLLS